MADEHTPGLLTIDDQYYADQVEILDSRGFAVISVESTPILLGYAEKLGIPHWSDKPGEAYVEFTSEQQAANARRVVACWNACEGIPTSTLEAEKYLQTASYKLRHEAEKMEKA